METVQKKRMLSGIKPTGRLTLGNYLGAIKNFIKYQDSYDMYIFIANLHAITTPQDVEELKRNTKDLAALYLACGLDPQKVTMFLQSEVLEHANLGWVLDCYTYMGELNRMTQYKDKMLKEPEGAHSVGLFTYPDLMAADILLYDADFIPVGEDQKQHVELCRDIADRFNNRYGKTFKVPEPLIAEVGAKIMSLSEPTKKMSKSDNKADKGCIYLLEAPAQARKKIMSAVTDTGTEIKYDPENKPGISNLLTIMSVLTETPIKDLEAKYVGCNYGTFKKELGDIVFFFIADLNEKYKNIIESGLVEKTLKEGVIKAKAIASKKLDVVYSKIGLNI